MSGDDDGSWNDQQAVIVAAGVAGLVLLALLVWAVVHTAKQVDATRTGGSPPVVGHLVDVHDEADVEHELYGAECADQ